MTTNGILVNQDQVRIEVSGPCDLRVRISLKDYGPPTWDFESEAGAEHWVMSWDQVRSLALGLQLMLDRLEVLHESDG